MYVCKNKKYTHMMISIGRRKPVERATFWNNS